jgi:GAF domain-containing protein
LEQSTAEGTSLLSGRLAVIDLTKVGASELTSAIRDEALRLLDGQRAIAWSYRPALSRLFAEQAGEEVRALELDSAEARDVMRKASLWAPQVVGIRRRLVEASFGVASESEPVPTLAVPLEAGSPQGLLLVQLRHWEGAGSVLREVGSFASQAAAVLANHDTLERARRNEAQLEALYRTAGEISSKLELETVLGAIVERACSLAEAPTAYLMLVEEPAQEIYMRVTTGITSPTFSEIRLKLGAGLGGMVAQEEQPFYTSDYLNDGRFTHDPMVDGEVRRESIKSILGVPMKAFEKFVGVLYVADRSIRAFTGPEVEILMSLAHHAALAIENAGLYERATRALAELEATNRLVQLHNTRLERADQVHRQLSEIILAGHGLSGAVRLMAELVGEPAVVLDERHRLLAAAGWPTDPFGRRLAEQGLEKSLLGDAELQAVIARLGAFEVAVLMAQPPSRGQMRLVVPVVAGAELIGSVWVETRSEAIDEERHLIEQAVRVVGLELLKERSIAEVARRLRRELLDELLAARAPDKALLARRALDLGVDLDVPYRLVVADLRPLRHAPSAVARAKDKLLTSLRGQTWCDFAGEGAGRVVALVRSDGAEVREELARLLETVGGETVSMKAVVSPPCASLHDYRAQFVSCERVLQLLTGRGTALIDLADALVLTLLFREGGEGEVRSFAAARLQPILRQRLTQRRDLLRTLEVYFDSGLSPTRTAAALHVHVNTVYYRLGRLRDLLGSDFSTPRRALDFQIALLAHRLTESNLEETSKDDTQISGPGHVDPAIARP